MSGRRAASVPSTVGNASARGAKSDAGSRTTETQESKLEKDLALLTKKLDQKFGVTTSKPNAVKPVDIKVDKAPLFPQEELRRETRTPRPRSAGPSPSSTQGWNKAKTAIQAASAFKGYLRPTKTSQAPDLEVRGHPNQMYGAHTRSKEVGGLHEKGWNAHVSQTMNARTAKTPPGSKEPAIARSLPPDRRSGQTSTEEEARKGTSSDTRATSSAPRIVRDRSEQLTSSRRFRGKRVDQEEPQPDPEYDFARVLLKVELPCTELPMNLVTPKESVQKPFVALLDRYLANTDTRVPSRIRELKMISAS